jgi:hypothetical protein
LGFKNFKYIGVTIEQVEIGGVNRPAVLARLERTVQPSEGGAIVTEEIAVSLADMDHFKFINTQGQRETGHPQADFAAVRLDQFYQTKIPLSQQEKPLRSRALINSKTSADGIKSKGPFAFLRSE